MELKVGVVGATGMVGEVFMDILHKRQFPVSELRPFASEKSLGRKVKLGSREFDIQILKPGCFEDLDIVFFSSGDPISKEWAPQAAASGAFAVDNSAAFRMSPNHLLCVPEINGSDLPTKDQDAQVIANPNCSTIQLVMALKPLSDAFGLEDVRVATYQAVSGSGKAANTELLEQTKAYLAEDDEPKPEVYPHKIAFNCLPHIGSFGDDGFCSEETKIMNETQKILGLPGLPVSAFTVRVPAFNSHAEAVWVTLKKDITQEEFESALDGMTGLKVIRQSQPEDYPLQREVSGEDDVYVGRVHKDPAHERTWLMWVVGDNILKGAALNGLQIAERIFDIKSGS